ncbi:DNA polymerase [Homarus gammarus nudivirus]|uniref:DNA-directed DNA polymerase n=1 Tax=Homarus gammarus nudivirus TaxID=2509616 RepID=A0A411HB41_9VIRU|nr:DNA polymerase [Homarus gammarus nudivirus]QBB28606.1 DNA polymerase [Homarus gammarus nudivirus]
MFVGNFLSTMVQPHYCKYDNNSQQSYLDAIPTLDNNDFLYVINWLVDESTNYYYGIGISKDMRLCKFKLQNVSSGLYVWCLDEKLLKDLLCNLMSVCTIERYNPNVTYYNNSVNIFDSLLNKEKYDKNWKLYKIHTESFKKSRELYKLIFANKPLAEDIAILGQWSLSTFLMMEMHVRNKKFIYCTYINRELEVKENEDTLLDKVPTVVFDIETVSNFDHRLPLGNYIADHIMSVTVVIDDELFTLFNMPVTNDEDLSTTVKLVNTVDSSKYYKIKKRTCYAFNTETDLLTKLFGLLEGIGGPYICLGYNTRGYDMPYLLTRSIFLNLPQTKNFYYLNGILTYSTNMIHVDLNQVIVKYFTQELTSFSLKNVAKELLEEDEDTQKVDFNARNLRYIYKYISDHNSINKGMFTSTMCQQHHTDWEVTLQTLAKYNEMDCLVVLALWDKLQYKSFIQHTSKLFFLPFERCTLSKLNEYLSGNMIFEGLQKLTIFGVHHDKQIIAGKKFIMTINSDNMASSSATDDAESSTSYGGGFNFRLCKGAYPTIYAMDAQAYYPEQISGSNLSHETSSIISVSDFLTIYKHIDNSLDNYLILKFCTHKDMDFKYDSKSISKIEQSVAPFAYINYMRDNCPTLQIEDIKKCKPTDKLVIINNSKKGILSNIIEFRNTLRNIAKENKKIVKNHIDTVQSILVDFQLNNDKDEEMEEEDEFADSDDEDDDNNSENYSIHNYYIPKKTSQSDEEYLVTAQLELLTKEQFNKFDNKLEAVRDYLLHLQKEFIRLNSHYRNMKLLNNSIYGLLGSSYSMLKAKNIAAIVTMLGRMHIIHASQVGNKINGSTVYSDTDSVYFDLSRARISNPNTHIIQTVASHNNHVMLNVKIYKHTFIMGRKTYIAMSGDTIFSRGINKNGPLLWKYMMDKLYYAYIVKEEELSSEGVLGVLMQMYCETYNSIKSNKEQVLRTIGIQSREDYKNETPVTKLIDRITKEFPTYVFGSKLSCFYKLIGDSSNIHYALDFELSSTSIRDINLFKFYSNMTMTFYSILSYAIERTVYRNHNIVFKYSHLTYKKINKVAYLKFLETIDKED